jgi:hypothetical protein
LAHFSQIDENNIVTQVIVVANEDTTDTNGVEVEEIGVAFCKKLLGAETNWKQTSYNNNDNGRMQGHITDLKIYKGLAKYTSNFTPPNQIYLT